MLNLGDRVILNHRAPVKHWVGVVGTITDMREDGKYGTAYRVRLDVPLPHPRGATYITRTHLTGRERFLDPINQVAAPVPAVTEVAPKVDPVKPIKRMPPNFGRDDVLTVWDLARIQNGKSS